MACKVASTFQSSHSVCAIVDSASSSLRKRSMYAVVVLLAVTASPAAF